MRSLACLNGELMPVDQAKVPVWDRGFLFGDSVYEVLRLYQGCCWLEDEHTARLRRSLTEMSYPPIVLEAMTARMHRTISVSGIQEGTVYVQITRGVAPPLHAFPESRITLDALKAADEVLLLGTTIEVLPIIRVDDQSISGAAPGPVARKLQAAFREAVERWLAPQPV